MPSKFKERLNVPEVAVGTTIGVGDTVGDAVGNTVGDAVGNAVGMVLGSGVGAAVAVGMVLGSGVGAAVAVGIGVGVEVARTTVTIGRVIGVEVGIGGTGVYRARLSTQPVIDNESKPTNTTASLAT